jgi:hypothetical protein
MQEKLKEKNAKFTKSLEREFSPLDALVRKANRELQANRVCRSLCENDGSCKKNLLAIALLARRLPNSGTASFDDGVFRTALRDLKENTNVKWPADSYAYPSSILPDRNPNKNPDKGGTSEMYSVTDRKAVMKALKQNHFDAIDIEEVLRDPAALGLSEKISAKTFGFKNRPGVETVLVFGSGGNTVVNPSTPRPKVSGVQLGNRPFDFERNLSSCFQLSEKTDSSLKGLSDRELYALVMKSDQLNPLLVSWPPNENQVLKSLRPDAMAVTDIEKIAPVCVEPTSPILSEVSTRSAIPALQAARILNDPNTVNAPLAYFTQYCTQCHGSGKDLDLKVDFNSLESIRNFRNGSISILSRIKQGSMPPANAPQPSVSERARMIEFLSGKN